MTNKRVIALGDSLTVGIGDDTDSVGAPLGWVQRFTKGLDVSDPYASDEVLNLGEANAKTPQVRFKQLPVAAQHTACYASLITGMNDVIGKFDSSNYERDYASIVKSLASIAPTVLTATLPDISQQLGLDSTRATTIRQNILAANEIIRRVSALNGTVMFDAWAATVMAAGIWSADGLHPNAKGYAGIADAYCTLVDARPTGELKSRGIMNPDLFKNLAANPETSKIAQELADDVELYTPVTLRPFRGRGIASKVLSIVLGNVIENAEYRMAYHGDGSFCMVFSGNIGTAPCQGVDVVEVNDQGQISRVSVALRPLPAVLAMARRMAPRLHDVGIEIPSGALD